MCDVHRTTPVALLAPVPRPYAYRTLTPLIQLADGVFCEAEIHWYEAHGVGRKEFKAKRVIR